MEHKHIHPPLASHPTSDPDLLRKETDLKAHWGYFIKCSELLQHIPGLLGQSQPPETSGCMETVGVLEAKQNGYV